MRISAESVNEARPNEERRIDEQKTSDRFSQLLKSRDEKGQAQQSGNNADAADTQQKSPSTAVSSVPYNLSGADASTTFSSRSPGAIDPGKIAQQGVSTPAQIDKLTTEIGQQIDTFKQQDGAQAVNITFDSRTLEGLQVQIRQHDGELAIRFVTQSDNVSKLLSRHSGELREALAGKGVRIGNIAIMNSRHAAPIERSGNAGA